jgi:hypothetical protein
MGHHNRNQKSVAKVTMVFGTKKTGNFDGEVVEFHELCVENFQLRVRTLNDGVQLKVRWFPHRFLPYLVVKNWVIYNKPKFRELLELLEPYFNDLHHTEQAM